MSINYGHKIRYNYLNNLYDYQIPLTLSLKQFSKLAAESSMDIISISSNWSESLKSTELFGATFKLYKIILNMVEKVRVISNWSHVV